jgi:hypothetical protein
MKRTLSILLLLALVLGLFCGCGRRKTSAADRQAAEWLDNLGFLGGMWTPEYGRYALDLDKPLSREEAELLLARLSGEPQEVFPDPTAVKGEEYAAGLLRLLGYAGGGDYSPDNPWTLTDTLGLTAGEYPHKGDFTRAEAASLTAAALDCPVKGEGETLLTRLKRLGAIDPMIRPLRVRRRAAKLEGTAEVEPWSRHWYDTQEVSADLASEPGLAYSLTFGDDVAFTGALPAGFDPAELLEWGKYPGLNTDILRAHGFTGKGVTIAYVDQACGPHEEYDRENIHIYTIPEQETTMHGPGVMSLLAGETIGIVPEATIYHFPFYTDEDAQAREADCLYRIMEFNQTLPEDGKIRMVGFSDNIDPREDHVKEFREAAEACRKAGIMVWFCGDYAAAVFLPGTDKNDPEDLMPDYWYTRTTELVYVPVGGRTTAANLKDTRYIYYASSGLSWAMPYALGLYTIALGIDPDMGSYELSEMLRETAHLDGSGRRIVDPVAFVAAALDRVGRTEEAEELRAEVRARQKYLYAVLNTEALTEADRRAVCTYLAQITEATVLTVDASRFADAGGMLTAIERDAAERGGTVAGIQLIGTRSAVPAFDTGDGPWREAGWKVLRLPLETGEYSAFFAAYGDYALETGLLGPDYWETHADAPRDPEGEAGDFGLYPPNPAVMALCDCYGEIVLSD